MPITPDDVRHVSRLARLELSDSEIELFTEQLGAVLNHASKLIALDLTEVPPTAHPIDVKNVWRRDEPGASLDRTEALSGAPKVEDAKFAVPRILEVEEVEE